MYFCKLQCLMQFFVMMSTLERKNLFLIFLAPLNLYVFEVRALDKRVNLVKIRDNFC